MRTCITVTYNAKPDVPSEICHKFPLQELTRVRTRKFDITEWRKAWIFISECTSSITTLRQLVFAMPRNTGKKILDAINEQTVIDEFGRWKDTDFDDFNYEDLSSIMHYSTEDIE